MKIAVMVEEGVRRLRNYSRGLDWERSRMCLEKFARKLRRSGYPHSFRHQVIKSALDRWKRMCKEEDEGVRPVHRPREFRREERKVAKISKKQNWHQGGSQLSAPLILDPVAGPLVGQLQEECRKGEDKFGIRVVVATRAGQSVRRDAKVEPLRKVGCDRQECFPCTGAVKKKPDCERNSVGYRTTCLTCQQEGSSILMMESLEEILMPEEWSIFKV